MKLIIMTAAILGALGVQAVEPVPTSPTKEKLEVMKPAGGALKVQKKPAEMEGLPTDSGKPTETPAPETKKPAKKK